LQSKKYVSRLEASLLYTMWRRRQNRDGHLSTAKELYERIAGGNFGKEFIGLPRKRVMKALIRMVDAGLVEVGTASKDEERKPGPSPRGYRLPSGGSSLITRQSAAQLLLELFHHPDRPVDEERFVSEAVHLGVQRDDTGLPIDAEYVRSCLEYFIRMGFVEVKDEGTVSNSVRHILCTPQVDEQLAFLEMIGGPKRAQFALEARSDSTGTEFSGGSSRK
jgi:hypothetical protein